MASKYDKFSKIDKERTAAIEAVFAGRTITSIKANDFEVSLYFDDGSSIQFAGSYGPTVEISLNGDYKQMI